VDRLDEMQHEPRLEGPRLHISAREAGQRDEPAARMAVVQLPGKLAAVHAGQRDVQKGYLGRELRNQRQRFKSGARDGDVMTVKAQ